jgi:Mg-chelatase subunit ChlD
MNCRQKQRGGTLLLFTFAGIMVVIPMIGLAIDGAVVFLVKAKLSAAVDSGALAAGRSPSANATSTAQQYVYANFPIGWMGTTFTAAPSVAVDYPATGMRRVTVNASVVVPLHFIAIFGVTQSLVPATAASVRRNANIMLVLDRSSSMTANGADGVEVCKTMMGAATTFVNFFADGSDQLGLITFHTWSNVDFPFTKTFQSSSPNLTSVLSDIVCGGNTSSAMALNMAYNQIKQLGSAAYVSNGALNVIVFFTDGQPNGITAVYPSKAKADNRYYANPNYLSQMDNGMPATSSQCQNSLKNAAPSVLIQGSSSAATGLTEGLYQVPSPAPTTTCASGQARAICNTTLTFISATGCYFVSAPNYSSTYPIYGHAAVRQDAAYIPTSDYYGNATVNSSYMTQSTDLITGVYASSGAMRLDTPISVTDASFNAADAQALTISSDTLYQPVIYTIGLGGASDLPSTASFQRFLKRVANDPSSDRYNSSLPTGMFVYSPDDTELAAAFHQIASQILRLSK